jgi:hypothetical protein
VAEAARLARANSRPAAPPAVARTSLSQQLLEDTAASSPERGPDRQLLAPSQTAREQQVPDVRAGDQQYERNGRQQRDQCRADVADDQFL